MNNLTEMHKFRVIHRTSNHEFEARVLPTQRWDHALQRKVDGPWFSSSDKMAGIEIVFVIGENAADEQAFSLSTGMNKRESLELHPDDLRWLRAKAGNEGFIVKLPAPKAAKKKVDSRQLDLCK